MRVAIDVSPAMSSREGQGRVARELILALARIDHTNDYKLYYRESLLGSGSARFTIPQKNFTTVVNRIPYRLNRLLVKYFSFGTVEDFVGRVDVIHASSFSTDARPSSRTIVTVHDIAFLVMPECYSAERLCFHTDVTVPSIRRATLVLADSESTKSDIVKLLGVPPDRIRVVYLAAGSQFRPIKDEDAKLRVAKRYGLPSRFILFPSGSDPRKNCVRMLQAFHRARSKFAIPHQLVLAGDRRWLYADMFKAMEALELESDVTFTGYIPDEDFPVVYNLADAVVYPSLYEGFGLPPLEAMSCGVPVVTSNVSSIPEVVQDAALLIDPSDVGQLAEAMAAIVLDTCLRETLAGRGLKRAQAFSWEKSASAVLSAYEEVLSGNIS